jgi:hypothetical protein
MTKKAGTLSDEQAQASARRREKDRKRQDREDLRAVMNHEPGRRWVYRLVYGHLRLLSGYSGNDQGLYRYLGRQDAGRELLQRIQEQVPDLHERMVLEQVAAIKKSQQLDPDPEKEPEDGN